MIVIKFLLLFFCMLFAMHPGKAQRIAGHDLKYLALLDDSLANYSVKVLDEMLPGDKLRADSMFTRLLVRALRIPYSFYYPFDSVQTAPILYPDDSSFRIITWHFTLNESSYRQKGVLQMNTTDGSLKIFPLFDVSEFTAFPNDSVRNNQNWIGALYYKMIQKEWQGRKIYTLLGYDENNDITTRKWMDILTFNDRGEPQWGGDYFAVNNDTLFPAGSKRFLMEYKSDGRARLNFDEEEDMIIMDYLVSETNEPEKKYTMVPGGDYAAFKWNSGRWQFIPKLDNDMLGDGNEPRPVLILTDDGIANEDMLQKQSDKNMNKKNENQKPPKKVKPVKNG